MDENDLVRWASKKLRESGRSHEATLVESAMRRGQPHRVRGLVREMGDSSTMGGVAAMQQHPAHGGPTPTELAGVANADAASVQAFQREEPDPAA